MIREIHTAGIKKTNCLLNGELINPVYSPCEILFKTTNPIKDKMVAITMILKGNSLYSRERYPIT